GRSIASEFRRDFDALARAIHADDLSISFLIGKKWQQSFATIQHDESRLREVQRECVDFSETLQGKPGLWMIFLGGKHISFIQNQLILRVVSPGRYRFVLGGEAVIVSKTK